MPQIYQTRRSFRSYSWQGNFVYPVNLMKDYKFMIWLLGTSRWLEPFSGAHHHLYAILFSSLHRNQFSQLTIKIQYFLHFGLLQLAASYLFRHYNKFSFIFMGSLIIFFDSMPFWLTCWKHFFNVGKDFSPDVILFVVKQAAASLIHAKMTIIQMEMNKHKETTHMRS